MAKRRLQIMVKPETYKIIQEYSDSMGTSVSRSMAELIEGFSQELSELTHAVNVYKNSPAAGLRHARDTLFMAVEKGEQEALNLSNLKPEKVRK